MVNKYTRHQSVINKQSDSDYSEDHWLRKFEENLEKGAVQPRQQSLFEQINSIMNGKSKYPSVQAAVDDMMHRSGLSDYLNKRSSAEDAQATTKKIAQTENADSSVPKLIKEKPSILKTLQNIIHDTKGNMPVPAIISRLQSLHSIDVPEEGMWDSEDLIRFVSKCNLKAKKDNPANYENYDNLGQGDHSTADSEIDPSNTDAFNALMPSKI